MNLLDDRVMLSAFCYLTDLALYFSASDHSEFVHAIQKHLPQTLVKHEYFATFKSLAIKEEKPVEFPQEKYILSYLEAKKVAFQLSPTDLKKPKTFKTLNSLFTGIAIDSEKKSTIKSSNKFAYQQCELTPKALFPVSSSSSTSEKTKNKKLFEAFLAGFAQIPKSHQANLPLWFDHFDSLVSCFTSLIAGSEESTPLYEEMKATAALAVAIQHLPIQSETENEIIVIQGDLFGIQDFIFTSGEATQKRSSKLLRGRSFYVSLLTECASLKVLETLQLPASSQVMNAAGKFQIIAPYTPDTVGKIQQLQHEEFDTWFKTQTFGVSGIGVVPVVASRKDFNTKDAPLDEPSPYKKLTKKLFAELEKIKLQRFDLCSTPVEQAVFSTYNIHDDKGVCAINRYVPATCQLDGETLDDEKIWVSDLSYDQISIGRYLTHSQPYKRFMIATQKFTTGGLKIPIFGYHIVFTRDQEESGKFGRQVEEGIVRRFYDYALPATCDTPIWNGYARRYINGYIPRYEKKLDDGRYEDRVEEQLASGDAKRFDHLACDAMVYDQENGEFIGVPALMTVKGDVDNLGTIFQNGLKNANLAKTMALSRYMNAFFAVYLPAFCAENFPNTYTVFAGGDDFFLIGPWRSQLDLMNQMWQKFAQYVAHNEEIHFSVGTYVAKAGIPVKRLADQAEHALEEAKAYSKDGKEKNAVNCFGASVNWEQFHVLYDNITSLSEMREKYKLSTAYIYSLIELIEMAERAVREPRAAIWHSYFYYRTMRFVVDKLKLHGDAHRAERERIMKELATMIAHNIKEYKSAYKIALFSFLYQFRKVS